jgi:hypothetical protein
MISPLPLKLNLTVICIPGRASSSGGGIQQSRNASNMSESVLRPWPVSALARSALTSDTALTIVNRKSSSIGYSISGTQGPRWNALHTVGAQGYRLKTLHTPGQDGWCLKTLRAFTGLIPCKPKRLRCGFTGLVAGNPKTTCRAFAGPILCKAETPCRAFAGLLPCRFRIAIPAIANRKEIGLRACLLIWPATCARGAGTDANSRPPKS